MDRYLMSYNFFVIMGAVNFRASKVKNIGQSVELETYLEGGHTTRLLARPPSKPPTLLFERGFCNELIRASSLIGIPHPDGIMQIQVFDRTNTVPLKTYMVYDWMVTKWNVEALDALSSRMLLETVEVTYTRMTVV